VLYWGLKWGRASFDGPNEPAAPTTTAAASARGHSAPHLQQPMSHIEQYFAKEQCRIHHQFSAGVHLVNRYMDSQQQAFADVGIGPAHTPVPDPPPGTSSPPDSPLPQLSQFRQQGHLKGQFAGFWDYEAGNSEALVRSFVREVGAERLRALVSSPFSTRLAHLHDSLTKLHCAMNRHAVDAAEEVQARAVSTQQEKEFEMRDALRDWAHASPGDSAWHSRLVACANTGCSILTRRRSTQLESTEGIRCSFCPAMFCSYECQLSAMCGPQAHCGHFSSQRQVPKTAADPSKARQGRA